ncbi:MafI family immunity protein [Candidatus Riflebacteria bacterium]
MIEETERLVSKALQVCSNLLTNAELAEARELNEHREWGLSLELLYTQLHEKDVKIQKGVHDVIMRAAEPMGLREKAHSHLAPLLVENDM